MSYRVEDARNQLLREAAKHLRATEGHWGLLPEKFAAKHLSERARNLAERIERLVGTSTAREEE